MTLFWNGKNSYVRKILELLRRRIIRLECFDLCLRFPWKFFFFSKCFRNFIIWIYLSHRISWLTFFLGKIKKLIYSLIFLYRFPDYIFAFFSFFFLTTFKENFGILQWKNKTMPVFVDSFFIFVLTTAASAFARFRFGVNYSINYFS